LAGTRSTSALRLTKPFYDRFTPAIALLLTIVVWFVILITGRYPKGLFEFNTGALRLTTTTALYSLWTTNKYPL
jgi:hypothetical protein